MPRPDEPTFDPLLWHLADLGLPMVGIGRRWGPFVPRIAQPSEAPDPLELDRDMERVARARWADAQPWYPREVTAANRDEVARRRRRWNAPGRWQPRRHPAMQMSASSARHLGLRSDQEIGEMLGLAGTLTSHARDARRFRTVDEIVRRGDRLWAAFGAWPWAVFPDGDVPARWWEHEAVETALMNACATAAGEAKSKAAAELARAQSLRELAPGLSVRE